MRFRFTIRDLFWLTLVVALAVGWWIDRARLGAQLSKLEQQAYSYMDRRDVYHDELVDLIKVTRELANEPGYEKLKIRLKQHDNDFSSK